MESKTSAADSFFEKEKAFKPIALKYFYEGRGVTFEFVHKEEAKKFRMSLFKNAKEYNRGLLNLCIEEMNSLLEEVKKADGSESLLKLIWGTNFNTFKEVWAINVVAINLYWKQYYLHKPDPTLHGEQYCVFKKDFYEDGSGWVMYDEHHGFYDSFNRNPEGNSFKFF